ncbi:adenosylcobinamide-GDP ribazoletransferase [Paradesulfitobacterium aromaticivorans]
MEFLLAIQFLTKIPITVRGPIEEKDLARAMAYFPLVGLLLGAIAGGIHTLLSYVFTAATVDLITIAFLVIITGNLHGDALMDSADGLFSGRPLEGILAIMKDSRVGSHGVIAGTLAILAKFVLLGQLPLASKGWALVLVLALGRWAQVYGATLYPYARTGGGTGSFTEHVRARELVWASLTVLVPIVLLLGWQGSILAGSVLIGTAGLAYYISGKIGGMTGDTLGALNEWAEVLALLTLQIILK